MKTRNLLAAIAFAIAAVASQLGPASAAGWELETVDAPGIVGQHTSIAIDPASNTLHVSYYDTTNGDLKYARQKPGTAAWTLETVDGGGIAGPNVGQFSSIALKSSGRPCISYYDLTNGDLRLACKSPAGAWDIEVVDFVGNVGQFTSLKVDAGDRPHISYFDVTNTDLKYAVKPAGWLIEVADASGDVGRHSSIGLQPDAMACISYFDATPTISAFNLKFACRLGGGSWDVHIVDTPGDVGRFTSLAMDGGRPPSISYYDATNGNLKFAKWVGGAINCGGRAGWMCETVDGAGADVGQFTSLKVDANNVAHISYFDVTNADLKYAMRPAGWIVETVDALGNVGQFTSLALSSNLDIHITYFDIANGNLKHARKL
jgi:hypothetical protein